MKGHPIARSALTTLLCAASLLVQDATPAAAQAPPGVGPGSRVRITSTSLGVNAETGIVRDTSGGSFLVRFDHPERSESIELQAITALEVSIDRERQSTKGLGIGMLVGAGLGVVIGLASGDDPPGDFLAFSAGDKAGVLGAFFGAAGAVLGFAIGSAAQEDVWIPVPVDGGRW